MLLSFFDQAIKKKSSEYLKGITLQIALFFITKQKRKCYHYCYLRRNSAPATANNRTKMLPKCFKKS